MRLYHFTCRCCADRIRADGALRPIPQPQLDGRPLVWLTDLDAPDRLDVGLTSVTLRCDRMEFRAIADGDASHWPTYLKGAPRAVQAKARALHGLPMHWYVSEQPVPVLNLERWMA